ncbi:MAG: DUF4214 domain-containing protein [Desulfobacter sp.]|nr:MAG: DUF4214 domain-containing protein [Desulfobacter sp.]
MDIGNLTGKISYHYLPVNLNRQTAPKAPVQTPHPPKASSPAPSVASLNANDDTFVRSLYYSILDRQPDKAGVRHWKQLLDQGQSRTWVITQFFKSFEYTNRHKNNTEYVRDLYQGVLGRQPDPGGLAHWVNRLNSGSSRQSVLNGFLNSKEYHSRTSKG